ncbi:hypothetical protein H8356DRAFT_1324111 [Neocallimastix lanati (nom. inval.)]|nr:hypothetical protein H8356DRAFT_1324111 [Neocallimastix sp. JGI-2020a]
MVSNLHMILPKYFLIVIMMFYVKFSITFHPETNKLPTAIFTIKWDLHTSKNFVTYHSSFELEYGCEDQQSFDIAAQPTKEINKSSNEILLKNFANRYLWTMDATANLKNANKYWATRREEKRRIVSCKPIFEEALQVFKKLFNTDNNNSKTNLNNLFVLM